MDTLFIDNPCDIAQPNYVLVDPEYIYNAVAKSVTGTLTVEVIVIGIFFVAFAFMQHTIRDPKWMWQAGFWKRVILLCAVMLFTTYIAVAYDIEYRRTFQDGKVLRAMYQELENASKIGLAKMQLIVLLAIDLAGVGITCGLFASIYANVRIESGSPNYRLGNEVILLFFLTGLWHLVMIIWWIAYSFFTSDGMEGKHILFHSIFVFLHFLLGFGARKSGRAREWLWVVSYATLVFCVFIIRIWQYVDRLKEVPG